MSTAKDFEDLTRRMRMNLTALQAQLSDLKRMCSSWRIPEEPESLTCPYCGPLKAIRNERQLQEHLENVHGQVPE